MLDTPNAQLAAVTAERDAALARLAHLERNLADYQSACELDRDNAVRQHQARTARRIRPYLAEVEDRTHGGPVPTTTWDNRPLTADQAMLTRCQCSIQDALRDCGIMV